MTGNSETSYRIGIDVGDRSVGLAAIAYDSSGLPTSVLSAVSYIHDGGMDPDTGKSPQSRLATSGVARRTRRLIRNRHRRLIALDGVLVAAGIPVGADELSQTYQVWDARSRLALAYEPDESRRLAGLSLSIRHIARHRGWRNPWWGYSRLCVAPVPSKPFVSVMGKAESRFDRPPGHWSTLGQLVAEVAHRDVAIRPRTAVGSLALQELDPVISDRLMQEDSLAELRMILSMQRVANTDAEEICKAVFAQTKPHVPIDRIGSCSLIPSLPRASTASLEFQEFRVRGAVANLRIKASSKESRNLTDDEHDLVVDFLLNWSDEQNPRWLDVAELLGTSVRDLVRPSIEDGGTSLAPIDRTSRAIEQSFKKASEVGSWWKDASHEQRAELVTVITGSVTSESELSGALISFADHWSEQTLEAFDKLKIDSGRTAYSLEALAQLIDVMRIRRCDAYVARSEAFQLPSNWQPPAPNFDDIIEHPTVNRVNAIVRRFLMTSVEKWGLPEQVTVEHVRSSFFGPAARAEFERELNFNTKRRDKTKAELHTQGIANPTNADVRRQEAIQRQNSVCLYCGSAIGMTTSQLDHIVADAQGGSNRRDNLVAVCTLCNGQKGKRSFVVFASGSNRTGVSLDLARERLRGWTRGQMSATQFRRFISDVSRRLALEDDSDDAGDRSIESTAYAAREMRSRITSFLSAAAERRGHPDRPAVAVYSGQVTSEARRAGRVDSALRLRGKDTKDRLDRRHHAIDASVLTTLTPGVAVTLRQRSSLRNSDRLTGDAPGWKEYRGTTRAEQDGFAQWLYSIGALATILVTAVADDQVAVVRPLRLSPRVGLVHKATVEPLTRKTIASAFTTDEVFRACDRRLFAALNEAAHPKEGLPADSGRATALGLPKDALIELFPSNAAYLKVRGGAAALGNTVQHARVFAWQTKKGFQYGIVRMFTGEFPAIGFSRSGIDVMTYPLPNGSQAIRTANATVRAKILTGEAKQIGWLTLDDEIEVDVAALSVGNSKISEFLRVFPEKRWLITGFFNQVQISIAPCYLASEGVTEETPKQVAEVLAANRIPMSANVILGGEGCTIIRRTVLGRPRWKSNGLPQSWVPAEEARKAFTQ